MTYVNAVKYIKAHSIDASPSPERMRLLCHYLDDPQRQLKCVHIAGGSGKTCCTQMLSVILKESGYSVGAFTSPFVKEHREMITVDQLPISHELFACCTEKVASAVSKMENDILNAANEQVDPENVTDQNITVSKHPKITKNLLEGKISPSPVASEILCAVAFLAFKKSRCNLVLLECGDSRADPTGIIDPPLVALVCGSSFSEEQLRTGAGIIRRGTREVVSSAPAGEAYSTILDACVRTGSRLTVPAHGELTQISAGLSEKSFEYRGKKYSVPYCAEYQLLNALTAIETVYSLRRTGVALHSADVARGIAKARVPLRFEVFSVFPTIIIDCPSTHGDALAFCESLKGIESSIGKKVVLVAKSEDFCVNEELLSKYNFSVIEKLTPVKESEDKALAKRSLSLKDDEIMLVLGTPSFCGRIKNAISKAMAYR